VSTPLYKETTRSLGGCANGHALVDYLFIYVTIDLNGDCNNNILDPRGHVYDVIYHTPACVITRCHNQYFDCC
jgi:hypothetical protein